MRRFLTTIFSKNKRNKFSDIDPQIFLTRIKKDQEDGKVAEEFDYEIFSDLAVNHAHSLLMLMSTLNIENCRRFLDILLENKCNFSLQEASTEDEFNNTALVWAAANASNEFCAKFLQFAMERNINIGINVQCGPCLVTALHLVVAKAYDNVDSQGSRLSISNLEIAEMLVRNGADPNTRNRGFHTALDIAVARRDTDMIAAMLPFCNHETIFGALEILQRNYDDSENTVVNPNLLDYTCSKKPLDESLFNEEKQKEIREMLEQKLKNFTKPTSSQKFIEGGQELEMQSSC